MARWTNERQSRTESFRHRDGVGFSSWTGGRNKQGPSLDGEMGRDDTVCAKGERSSGWGSDWQMDDDHRRFGRPVVGVTQRGPHAS